MTVSFEESSYTVVEGGSVTVKVKLSAAPERSVTIPLSKANQGRADADDYSGGPVNVTFASADTEKTFTFQAASDSIDDDDESVKIGFGTMPTGVNPGTKDETTVSITDDDYPANVSVTFEKGSDTAPEGGSVVVKLTLSQEPERSVTIPLSKTNQNGASNSDYSGVPDTVSFAADETEQTFTFSATQDSMDDDDESVKVELGTLPTGISKGTNDHTVIGITDDDDPSVSVSFENATYTVAESDDSSTTDQTENEVVIKVRLSADPERSVTVPITKTNQGGASSNDYSGVPDSVTIPSGDTEVMFTFSHPGRHRRRRGERRAGLHDARRRIRRQQQRSHVSITDDDTAGVTISETALTIRGRRRHLHGGPRHRTGGGRDGNHRGNEHRRVGGRRHPHLHRPWDTAKTVTVTAVDDDGDDDGETFTLTHTVASTDSNYEGIVAAEVTVNVTDNDGVGVSVSETALTILEGTYDTYAVVLSSQPLGDVTVTVGGTSADVSVDNTTLTFTDQDWSDAQTVRVTAVDDDVDEDDETETLTHTVASTDDSAYNGIAAGSVTVSITDEDTAGVTISETSLTIDEGDNDTSPWPWTRSPLAT